MAVTLGFAPLDINVTLALGGDFASALVASVPWPVGTVIELRFYVRSSAIAVASWQATIVAERAAWEMDAPAVQAVINSNSREVRLYYTEGDGTVIVWGKGTVNVC